MRRQPDGPGERKRPEQPATRRRGGKPGFSARAETMNRSPIRPPNATANPANSSQRSAADNHPIGGCSAPGAAAVSA